MSSSPAGDRPLSVLVDARGLRMSGIGRYLREVLQRLLPDPRFGRFHLLGDPGEIRAFEEETGAAAPIDLLPVPASYYGPAVHARMALHSLRGKLRTDVAFFPHYDVPPFGELPPYVLTVHDLSHFVLRDLFPVGRRTAAWWVMRRAVARAAAVLVVSDSTRRDLVDRLPGAAPKVRVVAEGVGEVFRGGSATASPPLPGRPYLLCVGNRKPHKNLELAVEVLARLRPRHPALRLVLAGPRGAEDDRLRALARERGVAAAVDDAGIVDDTRLRALYAGAACFLFPSRYEGFGLPVLEAMAAGAPVVASDRASIPEVAGDAGLLADPDDPVAFAGAVERILSSPELRSDLVRRGRAHAGRFGWGTTAAAVAESLCAAAPSHLERRRRA